MPALPRLSRRRIIRYSRNLALTLAAVAILGGCSTSLFGGKWMSGSVAEDDEEVPEIAVEQRPAVASAKERQDMMASGLRGDSANASYADQAVDRAGRPTRPLTPVAMAQSDGRSDDAATAGPAQTQAQSGRGTAGSQNVPKSSLRQRGQDVPPAPPVTAAADPMPAAPPPAASANPAAASASASAAANAVARTTARSGAAAPDSQTAAAAQQAVDPLPLPPQAVADLGERSPKRQKGKAGKMADSNTLSHLQPQDRAGEQLPPPVARPAALASAAPPPPAASRGTASAPAPVSAQDVYREKLAASAGAGGAGPIQLIPPSGRRDRAQPAAMATGGSGVIRLVPPWEARKRRGGIQPLYLYDDRFAHASFQAGTVRFGEGTAELSPRTLQMLKQIAAQRNKLKGKIRIFGVAASPHLELDAATNQQANHRLAVVRSVQIAKALVKMGVPAKMIYAGTSDSDGGLQSVSAGRSDESTEIYIDY